MIYLQGKVVLNYLSGNDIFFQDKIDFRIYGYTHRGNHVCISEFISFLRKLFWVIPCDMDTYTFFFQHHSFTMSTTYHDPFSVIDHLVLDSNLDLIMNPFSYCKKYGRISTIECLRVLFTKQFLYQLHESSGNQDLDLNHALCLVPQTKKHLTAEQKNLERWFIFLSTLPFPLDDDDDDHLKTTYGSSTDDWKDCLESVFYLFSIFQQYSPEDASQIIRLNGNGVCRYLLHLGYDIPDQEKSVCCVLEDDSCKKRFRRFLLDEMHYRNDFKHWFRGHCCYLLFHDNETTHLLEKSNMYSMVDRDT